MSTGRAINAVFQLGLSAVFLFVIWMSVDAYLQGRASADWPPIPCRILEARVSETNPGGEGGSTIYGVDVRYEYEAGGRRRLGDTYAAASSLSRERATEVVASLTPGTRTVCFVDPTNPDRAVLAPGGHGQVIFFWLFVLFLFVVVPLIGIVVVDLRDRMRTG